MRGWWRLACLAPMLAALGAGCGGDAKHLALSGTSQRAAPGPLVGELKARLSAAGYSPEPLKVLLASAGENVRPVWLTRSDLGTGVKGAFETYVDSTSRHGFVVIVVVFDSAADAADTYPAIARIRCTIGPACLPAGGLRLVGRVLYLAHANTPDETASIAELISVVGAASGSPRSGEA
jgi:hypothetical protein